MSPATSTRLTDSKMNQMLIRPMDWGFPTRSQWIYGFSRMIFMGLPLRVTAIDCPVQ